MNIKYNSVMDVMCNSTHQMVKLVTRLENQEHKALQFFLSTRAAQILKGNNIVLDGHKCYLSMGAPYKLEEPVVEHVWHPIVLEAFSSSSYTLEFSANHLVCEGRAPNNNNSYICIKVPELQIYSEYKVVEEKEQFMICSGCTEYPQG